jgi:hypothetical protein
MKRITVLFTIVSMFFLSGCAAMLPMLHGNMQETTVRVLNLKIDPDKVKILKKEMVGNDTRWIAVLPDGKRYKCNELIDEFEATCKPAK